MCKLFNGRKERERERERKIIRKKGEEIMKNWKEGKRKREKRRRDRERQIEKR